MSRLKPLSMTVALLSAISMCAGGSDTGNGVRPIGPLLQQIESFVQQGMAKTGVPGVAVGIVYRDKVVYLKGFGVRKAGTEMTVNPDTVFQLASVSKPIAST